MRDLRKERDQNLKKTSSISSVIKRKRKERARLTHAINFMRTHEIGLNITRVYQNVREIDAEIEELVLKKRKRKNK